MSSLMLLKKGVNDVSGNAEVGGFIGYPSGSHLGACYSTGQVTGNSDVGGFVGYNDESHFNACFWDMQTSGRNNAVGIGDDTAITGHDTALMQTQSTFANAGWDFDTVWGMVDYPQFLWGLYHLQLSSSAGGSVVNPGEGQFYVEPGSTVALQAAAADSSFVFSHFEGNLYAGTNPYLLTVNHDYHIRAVFESVLDMLYVDVNTPDGAYENGTATHPFASILAAIEVARPGSTIVIAPGMYPENLDLENKSLILTGVDVNDAND